MSEPIIDMQVQDQVNKNTTARLTGPPAKPQTGFHFHWKPRH